MRFLQNFKPLTEKGDFLLLKVISLYTSGNSLLTKGIPLLIPGDFLLVKGIFLLMSGTLLTEILSLLFILENLLNIIVIFPFSSGEFLFIKSSILTKAAGCFIIICALSFYIILPCLQNDFVFVILLCALLYK